MKAGSNLEKILDRCSNLKKVYGENDKFSKFGGIKMDGEILPEKRREEIEELLVKMDRLT